MTPLQHSHFCIGQFKMATPSSAPGAVWNCSTMPQRSALGASCLELVLNDGDPWEMNRRRGMLDIPLQHPQHGRLRCPIVACGRELGSHWHENHAENRVGWSSAPSDMVGYADRSSHVGHAVTAPSACHIARSSVVGSYEGKLVGSYEGEP